uniref:Rac GTPase activating protein 1 n=1 Tax=Pavo cristatus TaxID=9049 RepID=A0A8C9FQQ9_PAVCR
MDTTMRNLWNLCDQLIRQAEVLSEGNEYQFIQLAKNFEDYRRKWQKTEQELGRYKDLLMKSEAERSALDVKLKHARNQVDVEIKRRQKAEADCEKLERQIQLIRELLMCDASGSIQLSEEQKSALAFLNRPQASVGGSGNKRLSTIDESGSILSDISFDKTDDSLGNESIVAKTTLMVPSDGGPIEAISTIQTVPSSLRGQRKIGSLQPWSSETSLGSKQVESKPESNGSGTPQSNGGVRLHDFVSKTVIKPESCVPCGKRVKFGKISLKCRDCHVVSHPECRDRCPLPCIPTLTGPPVRIGEGTLMDFVPSAPPMIPSIIVHCVNEIEQRGLHEKGLYRVSGCDKTVRELKEKFLRSKNIPLLSNVDDIHAICSLLKDFLRNLKEPLLTFRLNKTFMEAAEILDEDNSVAAMYQAVGELPRANRDTLAFLMVHLQRYVGMQEEEGKNACQKILDRSGIFDRRWEMSDVARIAMKTQLSSCCSLHCLFFFLIECIFEPLTTPERQMYRRLSSSSLCQRVLSTFS